MKSGLEKYCNKRLLEEGFNFTYEGKSFEILPSFVYEGQYLSMTAKKKLLTDKSGKLVRGIKYTDFILDNEKVIIERLRALLGLTTHFHCVLNYFYRIL